MGKEAKRNTRKNEVLEKVMEFLRKEYGTDVEKVSTSEAMMPAVDENGNEFYYVMKISVPRGSRNGSGGYTDYNGYEAAKEYKELCADKEADREVKAERKALAEAEKQRKRDAKKTIKELNQKGLKKIITEE